jgi:glycosyltransferase involved in cell wall biosynthesis
MKTKIIYRSYGGDNLKNRPAFYSKLLALQSLLRAAEAVDAEIFFLNDGPIPEVSLNLMRSAGEVIPLVGAGMRHSYVSGLRFPSHRRWSSEDLVWISEDDYLYAPNAFTRLVEAAEQLPADYFALYGGTDDYPVYTGSDEYWTPRGWCPSSHLGPGNQRWVQILSTASTFGARVGALQQDLPIFIEAMLPHTRMYRDHETCVTLQGYETHEWRQLGRNLLARSAGTPRARMREAVLVPFEAAMNLRSHRRTSRRRTLLVAEPNLATHMEVEWMAPGLDWERVAAETKAWGESHAKISAPEDGGPAVPTGPRILVVESSLRDNGGLRVSLENARQWQATGNRVSVAILQDVTDGPLARLDPSVPCRFLTPKGTRFRYTWPLALAGLVGLARQSSVVVTGSEIGFGLLLSFAAAKLCRRPFAVLVQSDLDEAIQSWVPRPLRRLTRWVNAHADAAVCVSDSIVPGVVANGLPPHRAHMVINGINALQVRALAGLGDTSPGSNGEPLTVGRFEASSTPPLVVSSGRLCPQKDFGLLIRAHAQVRAHGVESRLVILGEGPSRSELEDLIRELGVIDSVELRGHVDNPHLFTSTSNLFVLSSRHEGMPLCLQEALAVGAPVVATRCSTGTELVLNDGEYGELVPVGSVDAMAAAIERHLRDPEPLRLRALRGPQRALTFDVASSAQAVLAILSGLAAHRAVAP